MATTDITQPSEPARLLRRLASVVYDCLLLIAIEMVAAALWLPLFGDQPPASHRLYHLYQAFLLLVALAFFVGFWLRGGQTLGMRAWNLHLQSANGTPPSPRQAVIRFGVAILSWLPAGLGFLWSLLDPKRRTWHDLASGTVVLHKAKPKKR